MKVIDNTLQYFNPFAKQFLEPLLQFIVDGCAGESINYFLMDVVSIFNISIIFIVIQCFCRVLIQCNITHQFSFQARHFIS